MLLTLSNPLPLAIVGNPPKGSPMARRRKSAASKRTTRLKSRWSKLLKTKGWKPPYSYLSATVRRKAGKRKHVRGHSWTGRKGTVALYDKQSGKLWGTNPRRGLRRFLNPGNIVASIKSVTLDPVMALPKGVPALFKGSIVKHVAFAAGGAVVGLVGSTMLQKLAMPLLAKIPGVSGVMTGGIAQRVVGASFALITGTVVGKLALKDQDSRNAFVTGAAAAALVEAIFPGRIAGLMSNVPVVGNMLAPQASPVQGLAGLFGYTLNPAYQGVGAYVSSPAYQGVGAYVQSPSYQGVGAAGDQVLAGLGYAGEQLAGSNDLAGMGSNMASHLDQ
jgi:hypothetical protein